VIRLGTWAAALALIASGCGRAQGPSPGTTEERSGLLVKRGALEDRMVLTGDVEAISSENLVVPRTPTWMISVRWLVEDGTTVKKGDRLVEFDSSALAGTLEDKRLAVVRAEGELASELARTAATVAEKQMEVDRKRAELDKATVEANVAPDLYPRRLHQEKQMALSRAQDALEKAEEDLAAQRRAARLDGTVKAVAKTRAERELEILNSMLDELTLRAPRDGLVQIAINRREGRKFLIGDQAFPGMPVVSMPALGAMQVRARLPDVDDGAVKAGMRADCVLDAYPGKAWPGTVRQVSPIARAEGRDATRRFFDVTVALDQAAPDSMRPGMSMRVEVVRRRVEGVLIVPRAGVRTAEGKSRVRLAGGADQPIELEWCTELACVVRAGVLEGTTVLAQAPVAKESS
jgi:multidrug efflux pump subunit AcrA (membrane-fusion protein)